MTQHNDNKTADSLAVDSASAGSALARSLRNCCSYSDNFPIYELTNIAADRIDELEERCRKCPTMDEAEKFALVRAIQEIARAIGMDDDNSPREIVERVQSLAHNKNY